MSKQIKLIGIAIASIFLCTFMVIINPFSWNDAGNRTVVERSNGEIFCQFTPGVFYAGFFSKEKEWPNQISVLYNDSTANYEMEDNGIEIGQIEVRFNDATTAKVKGIVQYILPSDEKDMVNIHVTHRTPQSLVSKRLAPYTKECLQSSAQLMSSEKHYGGGRAQMAQDFSEQLKAGVYLLSVQEKFVYDSLEKDTKRVYETEIQIDSKSKEIKRKNSSIKEYGVTVADASITDVDYETKVDQKLVKIIDATTKSAISKQDLMTAQQQALTAKAQGEQKLVEIEYQQKQEQTKQVVEAETKVKVAEQDLQQQRVQVEAAKLEAIKIKQLADAEAYAKQKVMLADGALDKKIAAYVQVQKDWAEAFSKYQGSITPQFQMGNGPMSNNAMQNFMELQNMKAMRDLNLQMNNK